MPIYQAKYVAARQQIPEPAGAREPVCIVTEFVVPAGLVLNDIIEMGCLPKWCVPARPPVIVMDDMDSNGTPTLKLDLGLVTGRYGDTAPVVARTCDDVFMRQDTTAQTGGTVVCTRPQGLQLVASDSDRAVGLKVQTNAATWVVGARVRCYFEFMADPGYLS